VFYFSEGNLWNLKFLIVDIKIPQLILEPFTGITSEQYRGFGFPGSDDLGNMFQFYRDFDDVCNSIRDVKFSKELNPELKSFKMWLEENGKRIPLD
jgi:hypothetical protein